MTFNQGKDHFSSSFWKADRFVLVHSSLQLQGNNYWGFGDFSTEFQGSWN